MTPSRNLVWSGASPNHNAKIWLSQPHRRGIVRLIVRPPSSPYYIKIRTNHDLTSIFARLDPTPVYINTPRHCVWYHAISSYIFRTMDEDYLIPDIEEAIPLPRGIAEAMPTLSPQEELDMAARTVQLLSDLTGKPLVAEQGDAEVAHKVAKSLIENPKVRPDYAALSLPQMALLRGMVAQYDFELVDDLVKLKNYVVNKLLEAAETAKDDRTRLNALVKLGEVDGIDAFKRRSEVTHVVKPIEEVEKELLTVLEGIEYRVVGEKSAATDA